MFALIALLAVSPIIPIALIGGIAGGAYAAWRFLFQDKSPMPTPDDGDDEKGKGDDEKTDGDTSTDPLRCFRSGSRYDAQRWSTPMHVAAGLMPLGYPVGPKLTSASDKVQIKRFQSDGIKFGLKGLKGAGPKAINGKMNACTLVALGQAEQLLKGGNWIPRKTKDGKSDPEWITDMRKMLNALGWDV